MSAMPRRSLGAILLELGRITAQDVEQVLAHQRAHGGFFGQALVSLGLLSSSELDWALANHFDLPFIFPSVDAIDRDAALLVAPEWALANLAVPILRMGDTLTVVLADPERRPAVQELGARTGLHIELALASADRVRELIREIFGEPAVAPSGETMACDAFLAEAAERGTIFGISARGPRALGWWYDGERIRRAPLFDGWTDALESLLTPSPSNVGQRGAHLRWEAALGSDAPLPTVEVRVLAGGAGTEYLFRPLDVVAPTTLAPPLPEDVATELRMLAAGRNARVALIGADAAALRLLLPKLPRMILGDAARAIHLTDREAMVPGVLVLSLDEHRRWLNRIREWRFDAATIDAPLDRSDMDVALDAAPLAVLLAPNESIDRLRRAGFGWLLALRPEHGWLLRPTG
jgi:hypothetical protein